MSGTIKITFFFFCLLLLSCATQQSKGDKPGTKDTDAAKNLITIMPAGSHEECMALKKGQVMVYRFRSSKPVDFNVHYHGTDNVYYPVSQSEVTEDNGMIDTKKHAFYIETQEFYCLMWDNPDMRPVNVSYECVVKEK
ncbi:MAG: hypothetical protein C4560_05695 [Nitrospiraceae bacterium]|nr:MAG: hypothetical protein C4560_05695 [Nitrospiraceae bacterium]